VDIHVDKWNRSVGWVEVPASPWAFTLDVGSQVQTWWKPGKGKYRSWAEFAGDSGHFGSTSGYIYYKVTK
jgi:hypothetical protein